MKRRRWVIAGSVIGVFLAVAIAAVASIDALRWRLKVAWLVGTGQVTDLGLVETLPMLKPGSPYWLKGLPETRNPYASIRNPYASDADVAAGEKVFAHECASCHAPDTHGGQVAPTLIGRSYTYGDSDWAVFRTVQRGVPTTAMPPHDWPDTRIWQVIGYLRSINVIAAGQATAQAAASIPADFRVPYAAIAAQALPGGDWLTYSGSYTGARHSTLKEIDRASVGRLAPRWIHQFEIGSARIEMSPIVYRETMFVTYAGNVAALDARNGQRLWEYARAQPPDARVCCGVVNRGVAILDDRIFYATIDAHLIALSTRTGAKLWDVAVVPDYRAGYAITAAPLVIDGLVITGIAGGDFPTRGFLAAYDAATGTERWRFRTIPEPGEPGHDSWPGDS